MMSATLTTPRLSEVACQLVIPGGIETSVWPRVQRRLADAGIEFDLWQQGFATAALGCRTNGRFAATIGGVVASIPRQVGKTFTVGMILIGLCIEFPGLRVVWTSHHNRTTTNTFRSISAMVNRRGIAPYLADTQNQGIRSANGEQEIAFRNGSLIMFGARERGFGRGMDAIDVEVFDEAQILTIKALEDMVPATNQARNPHGGLLFFLGTPPRPTDPGEAFTAKREKARKLLGSESQVTAGDQMYVEMAADSNADPDDRGQWAKANPSYPHRTPLDSMMRMRENIPDDESWLREALGIWPLSGGGLITPEMWAALTDPKSEPVDPVSFGVYVNQMQTHCAIAVAGYRSDGLIHVGIIPAAKGEPVTTLPGIGWIPGRLKELNAQWKPCATVVDGYSAAASLISAIEDEGVVLEITNATDFARACGNVYARVTDTEVKSDGHPGGIRHQGAPQLAASVLSAKKRDLGDGFAWDRKDRTADITQCNAVTLAVHGLMTAPPPTTVWSFYS